MDFKVDLSNCDREPIHIPGKVQAHAVLIGIDYKTQLITHVSDNVAKFFSCNPEQLLNQPFRVFLSLSGIDTREVNFLSLLPDQFVEGFEKENAWIVPTNGGRFHLVAHLSGPTVIVELEPAKEEDGREVQNIVGSLLSRILAAKSFQDTLDFSAQQIKNIIGYDRVMIYRFAEDGHGEVVAEKVNDEIESYLGLHYPASDIPKQARELYKKNLVRIIADVDATDAAIEVNNSITQATPLDMTDAVTRAVSPIHIQYLKNMGVKASFSVSLIADGELWGLIACHNYEPLLIDYRKRNSCRIIGQILSTSLIFRQEEVDNEQKAKFNTHLGNIIKHIRSDIDFKDALMQHGNSMLDITKGTGAALMFDNDIFMIGETPTQEQIRGIAAWLGEFNKNQFFQTTQLADLYPAASSFKDVASGLMSVAISREMKEYIFWFKKELPQTVRWAGNPNKPAEMGANGLLQISPRKSFEEWTEKVQGKSEGWQAHEISSVMQLREELVHIINERANQVRKLNEQLKQAYEELDTFSFTISHDLKTPLSSIKNYAELLIEEENLGNEHKPMLQKIVKGADRMNLLIREVLSYSRIGRLQMTVAPINMGQMLDEIRTELLNVYNSKPVRLTISNPVNIIGDYTMIYQVFTNIIGNAVKYSSAAEIPEVTVETQAGISEVTYIISDNGIGIDMKNGDQIFDLFKRMNNASPFEGTGVGLAIVKRIIEKHNARIWYESEPGNGTVFYLIFKTV
ncbi:MAG: hypothetical protein JWQ27_2268 [Ferruginibacter sp.]|nr:hypothetical protein [Ferruginibacter sp.]